MLRILISAWIAVSVVVATAQVTFAQGAIVSAGGPVHRAMGGASTAAPVSAIGSLYWNPATISGLGRGELEVGLGFLNTDHQVESTFGVLSGSTEGDPGSFPVPNFGWVHQTAAPKWTVGLGVNSVAGFKTGLPADPTNPVLAPQPTGLGKVSSEASFLHISPVVSYAATDRLSLAVGPLIGVGQVGLEPFVFDSANGDGSYPSGHATRYHWGGGVQAGLFYRGEDGWSVGASVKSPTWVEEFEFDGQDENGLPRTMTADIDLPLIVSVGAARAYRDDLVVACDVRFIDYAGADGFGDSATFEPDGSLQGLDWSSVLAAAVGVQRRVGKRIHLRAGYTYNQNPVADRESFFNIETPLYYQHMLSTGFSYSFCRDVAVNFAYSHFFENTRRGPIFSTAGPVPNSSVTNRMSAEMFSFGVLMRH